MNTFMDRVNEILIQNEPPQPNMPAREKAEKQRKGEDCRKTKRIILM